MKRIPSEVQEELNKTGLEWRLEIGRKHVKIYLQGCLAGTLPHNGRTSQKPEGAKNIIAKIRRAAEQIKLTGSTHGIRNR